MRTNTLLATLALAASTLSACFPSSASAQAATDTESGTHTRWSNATALTPAAGRVEIGLFSESSWALTPEVELKLHPVAFLVFPHVEAKVRSIDAGRFQLSSVHRLSYPTPFLALISREGSGGLLPPNTDPPQALLLNNELLGSFEWLPQHWLSLRVGASVATPGSDSAPLLDFPLLYPRLAALHASWVPTAALNVTGSLNAQFGYELEVLHAWLPLPVTPLRHSTEISAALHWRPNSGHQLSLGGRFSRAEFPIGWRSHFLPHIDYRMSL